MKLQATGTASQAWRRRSTAPAAFGLAIAATLVAPAGLSQAVERSGKSIVEASCIECHGTGVNGAPRIGDRNAWAKRSAQGLSALTAHALNGIRKMPPHGGHLDLTDRDIRLAVTYMVNQSGGRWAEPIDRARPPAERSGAEVVRAHCSKCHDTGTGGAPRVGDQAAWIPRVREGLDSLVRSAIQGHGGMPARGGAAQLTDAEMRSAIVYMFNAGIPASAPKPVPAVAAGQNVRIVDETTVHLGVVPSSTIRAHSKDYPPGVQANVPAGTDQYYVTVALFDANSGQRVSDAVVRARISKAAASGPEKVLEPVTIGGAQSYGNYFAMAGPGRYTVALTIHRAGASEVARTQFAYTHP